MIINRLTLTLVVTLLTGVAAAKTTDSALPLAPNDLQKQITQDSLHMLARSHYRKVALDDEMSAEILDGYLQSLDANRVYFTAADIERFEGLRTTLDDAMRKQDLRPAYAIYNVYRQRVNERLDFARARLQQPFDFELEEDYRPDRSEAPWAADAEALDEIWRKRVKADVLRLRLSNKAPEALVETLDKRYENLARRINQLDSEDVFQFFLNAYAMAIEPHTSYFAPRTSENFQISMRLSLEGIGALLGVDNEYTAIQQIVPGGPADQGNELKTGDRIVSVAQGLDGEPVEVIGWRVDDVVDLIRGPKGTVVRLGVLPAEAGLDGAIEEISITRNKVELEEQAAQSSIMEIQNGDGVKRIGVIDLPAFYIDFAARARGERDFRSSTRDVEKLIDELSGEGIDGLLVDLRNNGGGSLVEAIDLTGLFIDEGPVVQIKNARGRVEVEGDRDDGVSYDGPLGVLVNRNSASASEIFAAAIQDYGRGIIVGEQTFGKGTVQNLYDLNQRRESEDPRGQLKITVAQFFRINGGSTQHRGVVPDIAFPTLMDADRRGESSLDNALPWTSIKPTRYETEGDLAMLLPDLNARSMARVADDVEFQFLLEDYALVREARAEQTVSLNEANRRAELAADEARKAERRERREALAEMDDLVTVVGRADGLDTDRDGNKTLSATNLDEDEDGTAPMIPDAILEESATIVSDLIELRRAGSMAVINSERESGIN